jgi:hypothetical protein
MSRTAAQGEPARKDTSGRRSTPWLPVAAAALAVLGLTGCETTAEKSAKLERAAKRVTLQQEKGLTITRQSRNVRVASAVVLHDSERAAVVVTLENGSGHAQRDVPIAITVKDASGKTVFQNNEPGLESALVSVPSIPAHGSTVWVDDQVAAAGTPAGVSVRVGRAANVAGELPALTIAGTKTSEDPATGTVAEGTVTNGSKVAQNGLVVYAVGRRGGRIVAAGRSIVQQLASGASAPFQAALVGDTGGAELQVTAPAASFG